MDQLTTTDLYFAAYCVLNECTLASVECFPMNNMVGCKLTFTGENLIRYQEEHAKREAVVNLYNFRQAYHQVQSFVTTAKNNYRWEQREKKRRAKPDGNLQEVEQ